jgi:hypothetical protein
LFFILGFREKEAEAEAEKDEDLCCCILDTLPEQQGNNPSTFP